MIIKVEFHYRHAPTSIHRDTLDIIASHAYRDAQGRLINPVHKRHLEAPYPQSVTEGLRAGIFRLNRLLVDQGNPFAVPETAEPEEAAWRLVG